LGKNSKILSVLAFKKLFYLFKNIITILWLQKMVVQTKIFPSSFGAVVGSGMDKNQDPRSGMN
jgi:hypothetical protein